MLHPDYTGGPAFPVDGFPGDNFFPPVKPHKGMALRDYFAGQALVGFMSHQGWIGYLPETAGDNGKHRAFLMSNYARDAYAVSDAMLAARGSQERDSATGGAK